MKNRSVQAIAIGLSAISLGVPASMPMYAKAAEVVNDVETTTEQQLVSDSGEKAIAEEVSSLSEQLNTNTTSQLSEAASAPATEGQFDQKVSAVLENEATAKDAVGSVSASVDNIVKAGEAIGEAQTQAQDAVSQADSAVKNVGETTSAANEQAQGAVSVIKDENISKADAATIIADTDKTVEEAQTAFDEAENKYNEALEAYNTAKDDYDTALAAYNANKEEATGNLIDAESALESAQEHLGGLQEQLEAAKKELADAGADALVAAENAIVNASEEERQASANTYIAAILQYYYLPKTEELSEGQTIEDLRIEPMSVDGSRVSVIYSIANADKEVIREIYTIYGYTVNEETFQLQIYSKKYLEIQVAPPKKGPELKLMSASPKKAARNYGERYINVGDEVWMQIVSDYASYITGVRAKIDAYNSLLASVEVAKADFQSAKDKVSSIKTQIEELNGAADLASAAEMARLEGMLESAQIEYSGAKENLENAKASLSDAKTLFNERFVKASSGSQTSSAGNVQSSSNSLASNIQSLEARIDQELIEIEEIQNEVTPTTANNSAEVSTIKEAEVADQAGKTEIAAAEKSASKDRVVQPQDILPSPDEIVTINEENVPLAITLAGMIQHAKWFIALGGVSLAGALVSLFEVKRRAATKIIDKLNQ